MSGIFGGVQPVFLGGTGGTDPATARANIEAQKNLGFTPVQQGGGAGQGGNKLHLGFDSGYLRLQVDQTDFGLIARDAEIIGKRMHIAQVGQGTWVQNTRNRPALFATCVNNNNTTGHSVFWLEISTNGGASWLSASIASTLHSRNEAAFSSVLLQPGWFLRLNRVAGANTAAMLYYTEFY